jgi:hypothetical protein
MSVIFLANTKDSPGATSFGLALSYVLSKEYSVGFCEADFTGGEIALLSGLSSKPGMVTLAAGLLSNADSSSALIEENLQRFPLGFDVVLAPLAMEFSMLIERAFNKVISLLKSDKRLWIADLGRFDFRWFRCAEFFEKGTLIVLVCKNDAVSLVSFKEVIKNLKQEGLNIVLVVTGNGPYSSKEIQEAFGLNYVFLIHSDLKELAALKSGQLSIRKNSLKKVQEIANSLKRSNEFAGDKFKSITVERHSNSSQAIRKLNGFNDSLVVIDETEICHAE